MEVLGGAGPTPKNALLSIPALRVETGFPTTCALVRSLCEQTTQVIGATCLLETWDRPIHLTVQERAWAGETRDMVMAELDKLPTWMEARMDIMGVPLQCSG